MSETSPGAGASTRPWQATVQARLTRIAGVDEVEEVEYDQGRFTRRIHLAVGDIPGVVVVLDDQAREELLIELNDELMSAGTGEDTSGLLVFAELLEESLQALEPDGGNQKSSARNCTGWSATLDTGTVEAHRIRVHGTCEFPTTGYSTELRPSEGQGINPRVLELDLIVSAPTGIEAQHVTQVPADYDAAAAIDYAQVHIRPDGPVLDVQPTST